MPKMTGAALVDFCRSKIGTPYIYGAKGEKVTLEEFAVLQTLYGKKMVWDSDVEKVGKVCVDCSGLITWACNVPLNSAGWNSTASVKEPISTLRTAPIGALVWRAGHIGVYSGIKNGEPHYIAADGSQYGVREVPVSKNSFTHWLLVEDVFTYEEVDEVVEKAKIIIDGKEQDVQRILKDGTNYIRIRDIADLLGYKVSSKGSTAILTKK